MLDIILNLWMFSGAGIGVLGFGLIAAISFAAGHEKLGLVSIAIAAAFLIKGAAFVANVI